MKFLKNIWAVINRVEFVTDSRREMGSRKHMRTTFLIYGIFIAFQLWIIVSEAQDDITNGYGVFLHVRPHNPHLDSYKSSLLGNGNYYITGTDGVLHWKPNTLIESILLNTFSGNSSSFDLLELVSFVIVFAFFIFLIKDTIKATAFNKSITSKFVLIIFLISMWDQFIELTRSNLGHRYISYITNGQFTANYNHSSPLHGQMLYLLLMLLMAFPQKALEIQKEQDLTI